MQEIRKNRQRIRKELKACFVIPQQSLNGRKEIVDLKSIEQDGTKNRIRRKTSFDITRIEDISYLKEIYISNSFTDLFQIGKQIGQGSQSVVYQCKEISTENVYAVKVIRTQSAELANMIKQQYIILKTLDHQNIIKAYYLFVNQIQCRIHMVFQLCSFGTLRDYMKNKIFRQTQAAQIIGQILNALVRMHQSRICHRDIKPENILYNQETGELKIIDFQIAKMSKYEKNRVQMLTSTGTLHYKAPQMFNGAYNELVDIWAVGVILYEMISGSFPFYSEYSEDLRRMIEKQQPDYSCANFTAQCVSFLKKLLAKNPLGRLSANEALKSPFMLRFSSVSSSSSPRLIKNRSEQELKEDNLFQLNVEKCLYDDVKINGKSNLPSDIGIRLCEK